MPNIALYAGDPLGPTAITRNLANTQKAGWTTIILSLFHIGRLEIDPQKLGDINFNSSLPIITEGNYVGDATWPDNIARLKQAGSSVTKIYASVGGGDSVVDYQTIQKIYQANGNSFDGTDLKKNFQMFRDTFHSIDGIDLDCEDNYDPASFVAFCKMLIGMGFEITFCPAFTSEMSFWVDSLAALSTAERVAVKRWNLQQYGGAGDPLKWAQAIANVLRGFPLTGLMLVGATADGQSPSDVTAAIQPYSAELCVSGAFIWNMDLILGEGSMTDYVNAIKAAF